LRRRQRHGQEFGDFTRIHCLKLAGCRQTIAVRRRGNSLRSRPSKQAAAEAVVIASFNKASRRQTASLLPLCAMARQEAKRLRGPRPLSKLSTRHCSPSIGPAAAAAPAATSGLAAESDLDPRRRPLWPLSDCHDGAAAINDSDERGEGPRPEDDAEGLCISSPRQSLSPQICEVDGRGADPPPRRSPAASPASRTACPLPPPPASPATTHQPLLEKMWPTEKPQVAVKSPTFQLAVSTTVPIFAETTPALRQRQPTRDSTPSKKIWLELGPDRVEKLIAAFKIGARAAVFLLVDSLETERNHFEHVGAERGGQSLTQSAWLRVLQEAAECSTKCSEKPRDPPNPGSCVSCTTGSRPGLVSSSSGFEPAGPKRSPSAFQLAGTASDYSPRAPTAFVCCPASASQLWVGSEEEILPQLKSTPVRQLCWAGRFTRAVADLIAAVDNVGANAGCLAQAESALWGLLLGDPESLSTPASAAAANADATRHRPRSGKTTSSPPQQPPQPQPPPPLQQLHEAEHSVEADLLEKLERAPGQLAEPDSDPGCATGRCPTSALLARSPRTPLFRAAPRAQLGGAPVWRPAKRRAWRRIESLGAEELSLPLASRACSPHPTTVAESASRDEACRVAYSRFFGACPSSLPAPGLPGVQGDPAAIRRLHCAGEAHQQPAELLPSNSGQRQRRLRGAGQGLGNRHPAHRLRGGGGGRGYTFLALARAPADCAAPPGRWRLRLIGDEAESLPAPLLPGRTELNSNFSIRQLQVGSLLLLLLCSLCLLLCSCSALALLLCSCSCCCLALLLLCSCLLLLLCSALLCLLCLLCS
uniref:Protein kinase domain-containing protein n=1 Tax=Macrostomum lignano TaxID=282301 RepID=A0A1I8FFU8_9PLAT